MVRYFFLIFNIFFINYAFADLNRQITFQDAPLSKSIKDNLKRGNNYVQSIVHTEKEREPHTQSFDFKAALLHPRPCLKALKKISSYENYKEMIAAVAESRYNPETTDIYLLLKASYLPLELVLDFKLPRLKAPGVYPFRFEKGFLKDLEGKIHIQETGVRCFIYVESDWKGKYSGFSDSVFALFTETVAGLGIKALVRSSSL